MKSIYEISGITGHKIEQTANDLWTMKEPSVNKSGSKSTTHGTAGLILNRSNA